MDIEQAYNTAAPWAVDVAVDFRRRLGRGGSPVVRADRPVPGGDAWRRGRRHTAAGRLRGFRLVAVPAGREAPGMVWRDLPAVRVRRDERDTIRPDDAVPSSHADAPARERFGGGRPWRVVFGRDVELAGSVSQPLRRSPRGTMGMGSRVEAMLTAGW